MRAQTAAQRLERMKYKVQLLLQSAHDSAHMAANELSELAGWNPEKACEADVAKALAYLTLARDLLRKAGAKEEV